MNVVAMFVLGLFIGWLAEWAIDWFYWRGRIGTIAKENTLLKERVTSLEAHPSINPKVNPRPLSAKGIPLTDKDGTDNFQAIKGIGPVFAKRLKDAGVTTFDQLSRLTSKELEGILGNLYKRFFSKQETILAQAKEYAKQSIRKN
jgi:predicted flap endonuclease-1-like 5' DNA nuclease